MLKSDADKAAKEFLTPPAIAIKLGVAHKKVLNFIESGELPAVDLSSKRDVKPRWHVRRSDLDEFLARRASRPPTPAPTRRRTAPDSSERFY